jgi:hypothetical protein
MRTTARPVENAILAACALPALRRHPCRTRLGIAEIFGGDPAAEFGYHARLIGTVAQLVEQGPFKALVLGSSPSRPTTFKSKTCANLSFRCTEIKVSPGNRQRTPHFCTTLTLNMFCPCNATCSNTRVSACTYAAVESFSQPARHRPRCRRVAACNPGRRTAASNSPASATSRTHYVQLEWSARPNG